MQYREATQVSLERNLSCCDYHSFDAITLIYHILTFLNNVLSNVVLCRHQTHTKH